MFFRSRVIPVNPNTERQGQARANMAQAVGAWSNILSDTQRQAWTSYAQSTPVVDRLGAQLILSGQQMFVKSALPRLIAGLALVLDGPTTSGLATTPTFTVDPVVTDNGELDMTVAVEGAATAGDLGIYMAEPLPTARTIAHSKRAFAQVVGPPVAGSFVVALNPGDLPFDAPNGLQTRITVIYLGDDGRVSSEAFRDVIITGGA